MSDDLTIRPSGLPPELDADLPCDECGVFGAFTFDNVKLCLKCCAEKGSCCAEFGKDDLGGSDQADDNKPKSSHEHTLGSPSPRGAKTRPMTLNFPSPVPLNLRNGDEIDHERFDDALMQISEKLSVITGNIKASQAIGANDEHPLYINL